MLKGEKLIVLEGTLGSQRNHFMATSLLIVNKVFLVLPLLGHLAFVLQGKNRPLGGSNGLKNLSDNSLLQPRESWEEDPYLWYNLT